MDEEVEKFWEEFEEETGERVQAKAVGQLFAEGHEQGVWYLLILTDRSFWFKDVPSGNWMSSLIRPRALAPSSRMTRDATVTIPLQALVSLEEPQDRPKRWFSRPTFPIFTLSWNEGGSVRKQQFSMDPSMGLISELKASIKRS